MIEGNTPTKSTEQRQSFIRCRRSNAIIPQGGLGTMTDHSHTDILRRINEDLREFHRKFRSGAHQNWTREEWEETFTTLAEITETHDSILASFGRKYLSFLTKKKITSARSAILMYLLINLGVPVERKKLRFISGIGEWARRVRELRVEHGWPIVSRGGVNSMYYLTDIRPNQEVKRRWQEANALRKTPGTPGDRMLTLLVRYIGRPVDADLLAYVAADKNWLAELYKLRSEYGLRVSTPADRPELEDAYLLETQTPLPDPDEWDISDDLRRKILELDERECTSCGWRQGSSDDRWLDVHRRSAGHELQDFATLCNICHERLHRLGPASTPIRLRRGRPRLQASEWQSYFRSNIGPEVKLEDIGSIVYEHLLVPVRVAGKWLPQIKEINQLRDSVLWHERVERVAKYLTACLGPMWYTSVGKAVRPPHHGSPGEGFEQILRYLIETMCGLPCETRASLDRIFPGRPFPDAKQIDIYVAEKRVFLSLKWSLRGDRLRQVQLEARSLSNLRDNVFFGVITNEYDVSRLRPLLGDPNINAVYHVSKRALESMWIPEPEGNARICDVLDLADLFTSLRD